MRLRRLRFLWRGLVRRRRVEREAAEELESFLELAAAERIRRGEDHGEARRAARLELGGLEPARERLRNERVGYAIETLARDLRLAVRRIRRQPGFAFVALVTLALGIGANAAIFSTVRAVLLSPLPFAESERLARLYRVAVDSEGGRRETSLTPVFFHAVRQRSSLIESMAAQRHANLTLAGEGDPERIAGTRVSAGWLETLGVSPALGRGFTAEEQRLGDAARVAMIAHGLWQRRFAGETLALGRPLVLDQRTYTIVGVLPPEFRYPYGSEVWIPTSIPHGASSPGDLNTPIRIRNGVTMAAAARELEAIAAEVSRELGRDFGLTPRPMRIEFQRDPERSIALLAAAVGCVLLLACVNLAVLLLARGEAREREFALRAALGGGRTRLVRQLLSENVVLATAGGAVGLGVAWAANRWLAQLIPSRLGEVVEAVRVDGGVLLATAGLCLGTGVAFGLMLALRLSSTRPSESLRAGGRQLGSRAHRLLDLLVITEVALATVLLVAAGLIGSDLRRQLAANVGYDAASLTHFQLGLSGDRYVGPERRALTLSRLVERVEAVSGVEAAGVTTLHPVPGRRANMGTVVGLVGSIDPAAATPVANRRLVTPGYFRALGLTLERGRGFDHRDLAGGEPVVIINRAAARRFWRGEDPVGRRLRIGPPEDEASAWHTIVGVVSDMAEPYAALPETVYQSYPQASSSLPPDSWITTSAALLVRTGRESVGLIAAVRSAAREVDAGLPLYDIARVDDLLAEPHAGQLLGARMVAAFGLFGLLLAALGIYGVLACSVGRRLPEFGVRLALGARPAELRRSVVLHGLRRTALGLAAGAIAALAVSPLLGRILAAVSPRDPRVFAVVASVLLAVGVLASWLPALRATRVDPAAALRAE